MTKQKFDRSKTHANVGTIGHAAPSSTLLTYEELMGIFNKTCGSVKLNHPIDAVAVIKEIRGEMG